MIKGEDGNLVEDAECCAVEGAGACAEGHEYRDGEIKCGMKDKGNEYFTTNCIRQPGYEVTQARKETQPRK